MGDSGENKAYMVLGYACNQKCLCCPCEKNQKLNSIKDLQELKEEVENMVEKGITDVTISGGEPTIYPNFFEIIKYIIEKNINIHILSNGEKFAEYDFANKFVDIAKGNNVTVTTTFHSYLAKEHELQNRKKGSFERSIKGLKFLDDNGIQISLKHCITRYNYKDLKNLIQLFLDKFSKNAEIQIWGIDYCGVDKENANNYFVGFEEIKPYIEEALDYFENANIKKNRKQVITLNNVPLCMCDCYYWNYYTLPDVNYYLDYMSDDGRNQLDFNYGPTSLNCKLCPFSKYCKGTYLSAFEMFGDDIVNKPSKEIAISNFKAPYVRYNSDNINKMYFSIYDEFYLTPKGLTILNRKTCLDINVRLSTDEITKLLEKFYKGIERNKAEELLIELRQDKNILNEWLLKGIVE